MDCLHGTCTTSTDENEKVTFQDGEIEHEVQDPIHSKDEGQNVKEDVHYITTHAANGSVENFSSHEDAAVLDHSQTTRDHYEFENGRLYFISLKNLE